MKYSPRYRLFPTEEEREAMDWTRDTVRQLYNYALREFNKIPEDAGTLRQRVWMVRDTIPTLKDWWPDLNKVYSTVLQKAVERIRNNINNLGELKANGYNVGSLNWKEPREYKFHVPSIGLRTRHEEWPKRKWAPDAEKTPW